MRNVVLYSTNCPKCVVLKRKLDELNVEYSENNDVDVMLRLGITQAPMLEVDGKLLDFTQAIALLREV